MRKLVTHVNEGKNFESYHEVPDTIHQQLYAEADRRSEAHQDTNLDQPKHIVWLRSAPTHE